MLLIITSNLELIIAKQIRRFCVLLLLNKRWQFGDQESLKNCLWFGYFVLLTAHWQFCDSLSLNIRWQFWQPLIAQTETVELVAFIGLGGVNNVFSHASLILVATSSIFAKSLLTNFFTPFFAARESDFSSRFSYHWHSELVHRTCAPMFLAQTAWVSWSKMLMGTW